MQKIISGNDTQLYDMIIEFHDELFKNKVTDFKIRIDVDPATFNMNLFQDFTSLINELCDDWDDEVNVEFEVSTSIYNKDYANAE